jgi:hypothetical protein
MLKKLLLILAFGLPLFAQHITGTGTSAATAWKLYNPRDVDSIRILGDGYYELASDIDFSEITGIGSDTLWGGGKQWWPLGILTNFHLDGKGHTIKNLDCRWVGTDNKLFMDGTWTGFIGRYQPSSGMDTIKNVTFDSLRAHYDSSTVKSSTTCLTGIIAYFQSTTTTSGMVWENVKAKNFFFWFNDDADYGNAFGVFIGRADFLNTEFYRCGIENAYIYARASLGNILNPNVNLFIGETDQTSQATFIESYVKNSHINVSGTGTSAAGNVHTSFGTGSAAGIFNITYTDHYSFNNTAIIQGTNNSTGDPWHYGALNGGQGLSITGIPRLYIGKTNLTITGSPLITDRIGWVTSGESINENWSTSYIDTTGQDTLTFTGDGIPAWTSYPPVELDSSQMINRASFPAFSFGDTWSTSPQINNGYPFLLWEVGELFLTTPQINDVYQGNDTIHVTWVGTIDTVKAYYSINNGISWTFIDTLFNFSGYVAATTIDYNGQALIRIADLNDLFSSISGSFTVFSSGAIEILYPLSLTATKSVGDTIHIKVSTVLIDKFSLFYSVNDSLHWVPIVYSIVPTLVKDTTIYVWILPNINGLIYLLATENTTSDTIDHTTRPSQDIGTNFPSQPAMCWYYLGGGIIEIRRYIDGGCGWISGINYQRSTTVINDYATRYEEHTAICYNPGSIDCITNDPLTTGNIYLQTGLGMDIYTPDQFYVGGDTITYKFRRYYIGSDSIFYCDDLVNGIDSLIINDLHDEFKSWSSSGQFPSLKLYNVQRSKIQNKILPSNTDFEALNDPLFIPVMLLYGDATNGRGKRVFTIASLDEPLNLKAASDKVLLFRELNTTRDYFRGIDPKARRHGR